MSTEKSDKSVLDPCCGSRMFWFDKNDTRVLFGDKRKEEHTLCDGRSLSISPDIQMDFTNLPFSDKAFKLVVFDPPHLSKAGPTGWQALKYGVLPNDWREYLALGFKECFRVLDDNGVLIFKWNEERIKLKDILPLAPYKPLFGHTTSQNGKTHWFTFMKPEAAKV